MARKLLTILGALFVLGLVGAAVVGLMVVRDRIQVVIQADAGAAGPDPVALLRDDVQVLQRELGELRTSLPGNFEQLGTALDERAQARHTEVQDIDRAVAGLRLEFERQAGQLAAMAQRLAAVDRRLEAAAAAHAEQPTPVVATPEVEAPPVMAEEPTVAEEPVVAAEPPPQVPPEVAPAPERKGFLSFSVPKATFHFDRPQDYVFLPELCRVGFDAKSTLHDFTGVTSKVGGRFTADFDDPDGAWKGEVSCEAATLTTGLEGRDTGMYEHLDAEHHQTIRFELERFEPSAVDPAAMTAEGTIAGRMTIRGRTQPVRMPIKVAVDGSRRVVIEGQMPLKLSDYDIPVPSQLGGAITMQDEVSVWIALRARAELGGDR